MVPERTPKQGGFMAANARPEFLPRGIWKGYHKRDGHPTTIAVDRHKQLLAEIVMHPQVDRAWVRRVLSELLEMVDPMPELAVVRDERAPIPPWPKRESPPLSAASTLLLYRRS